MHNLKQILEPQFIAATAVLEAMSTPKVVPLGNMPLQQESIRPIEPALIFFVGYSIHFL